MRILTVVLTGLLVSCGAKAPVTTPRPQPPPPVALEAPTAPTNQRSLRAGESLPPGQPFGVAADHDGVNTDEYRLTINASVVQTKPVSALVNKVITLNVPQGLQPGTYLISVVAVNVPQPEDECMKAGGTVDSCTVAVSSPTLSVPVTGAPEFTLGQWVEAWKCDTPENCAKYGDGVAARGGPSLNSPILGVHNPGVKGQIVAGPTNAEGFTWWQVNYQADPDGWSTETNLVASTAPTQDKDCVGTWSAWSDPAWGACVNGQQTRTLSRTFTVTQQPTGNGQACPASPETKVETRSCTTPGPTGSVAVTTCTFQLNAPSPDGATGWAVQFLRGTTITTNVGTVDKSPPYQRTISLAPGEYTFSAKATKGTVTVTMPVGTKACQK